MRGKAFIPVAILDKPAPHSNDERTKFAGIRASEMGDKLYQRLPQAFRPVAPGG